MKTKLSGGTVFTESDNYPLDNGFNCELWYKGKNGKVTVYDDADCAFKAEWNESGDFIARVGYFWGKEDDDTPSYKDLDGDIHAEYSYTKTGSSYDYSLIGVYGWSKDPLVEFYICDDSYNRMTDPWNTTKIGSAEIDGAIYNIYKGTMINMPSVLGDNMNFTQVFSIRQGGERQCGHISVTEHFKAWEKLNVKTGPLYDCKIAIETGGSKGTIDYHYATMWIGDENGPIIPEERAPFKDTILIPGVVEAEDYDKGGYNVAYYDSDRKNDGAVYRNDGVDIVETSDGYAVGYTKKGEWLEYTINVDDDDEYTVEASMANGNSAPKIDLIFDGQDTCSLTGKSIRNDWDTYTLAEGKVTLTEGVHTMRLVFNNDYTNIDFVDFKSTKTIHEMGSSVPEFELVYDNNTIKVISLNDVKRIRLVDMTGLLISDVEGDVLNVENVRTGVYVVVAATSNGEHYKKVNIVK
ncbi:MAG: glycoside hydrolase family 11 protein [Paludibacteraceae bacterium]|nr:glycoside hydrolase family 11 protein [Paludibacteraceae bacterium]